MSDRSTQNTNTKRSFWTVARLKWRVIGQSIVTVILLVKLLTMVVVWHTLRQKAFDPIEKTICLSCNALKWSGNEDLTGFKQNNVSDADYMTCCNLGSEVLDRLVLKHAISKHKALKPTRLIGSLEHECLGKKMKPYVKMTGINFTEMENDEDNIIRWNRTEYEGDVKQINGKIFIKDPGFYYLYSNLKLQNPVSNYSIVHSHVVYLHSYSRSSLTPILENSKSCCETTSICSETVSTIGAVFQLEKHDILFVRSSHPHHLVASEYSNMFGLYMM